jgi:hypothetical protein
MSHLRIKVHILYRRVLIKTLAYLNSTCSRYIFISTFIKYQFQPHICFRINIEHQTSDV